jgi:hypothetical protein
MHSERRIKTGFEMLGARGLPCAFLKIARSVFSGRESIA